MSIKSYNVVKDYWLISSFYPKGSTVTTEELMAKPYIDLGILQEITPKEDEESK